MFLRFLFTILILSALISPSYAASEAMPLSLKQCIDLALKNNVQILVALANRKQAQGEKTKAYADLLPQIDAVASQQRTWWENFASLGFAQAGVVGPFNSFTAEVQVSQRILDFSALAHAHAEKFKDHYSQLEVDLASQQVIIATSMAYIQSIGYSQELATSYDDVRLDRHFLDLSLRQLNAGLATSVDVARDRTQLAQELAHQEELKLNVERSLLELKRLVKIPLSQDIVLTDALRNQQAQVISTDNAITTAMDNRMELKVSDAYSRYTQAEVRASKFEHLPTITLTGAYGEMGLTPEKDEAHAANAMVSINLPIWEGNRTAGDIEEKEGLNDEEKAKVDDLQWKIEEDVRLALKTLESTNAQMNAVKQVQDFAKQELDLAQDRFSSGLGDNTQVIDAQVALADARDKFVQTEAQYDQAQLNYFAALGDPERFNLSKEGS